MRASKAQKQPNQLAAGLEYARDVIKGKRSACKWVKLMIDRHFADLKASKNKAFGFYFDEKEAQACLDFFSFLRHSKGKWAGKRFELEPWQILIVAIFIGWRQKSDHLRRFRTIYIEVPRKNGKSTMLAGISLYLLIADGEQGAEVYSAATKRDQARIVFDESLRMAKASKSLSKHLGLPKSATSQRALITVPATSSKFEPLSSDANSLDGLNVHAGIVDELHAHKTRELWDVLETATGARAQPLMIAITTAGFNKHGICFELRSYLCKILDGVIEDQTFFGVIYTMDDGDAWDDPQTWEKANPNFGISVSPDDLQRKADKASHTPAAMTNFLTKHLNCWVNADHGWVNMEAWKECGTTFDPAELVGATCTGGLDLASVSDLCAFVLAFEMPDGTTRTLGKYYVPEDAIEQRELDGVPYRYWCNQGLITATPGAVTDYEWIKKDILAACEAYQVKAIGFDRYNSSQLVNDLQTEGVPMVAMGQGTVSMSAPMRETERRYLKRQLNHNGDPVLSWAASNLVIRSDEQGNIKPAKNKSQEKIDPMVALFMAVGMQLSEVDDGSIYEERGILTL